MQTPITISPQLTYLAATGIMEVFDQVARESGLPKSLLLAVASRESNMGMALDSNWLGDKGNGIGLMQIDRRYHPAYAANYAANDHLANVRKSAEILSNDLSLFGGNKKQALAAYNAGIDDVRMAITQGLDPDLFTTGQDYGRDVLHRQQIIKSIIGEKDIETIIAGTSLLLLVAGSAWWVQKSKILIQKS